MSFDMFINFDGECREAVEFYAKVFKSEVQGLMAYSDMPPDESYTVPEEDKNKVMYSCVPIFGCNVMYLILNFLVAKRQKCDKIKLTIQSMTGRRG